MALHLFPGALASGDTGGTAAGGADRFVRHVCGAGVGGGGFVQRVAASVPEVWVVPGADAVCELFHDRNLSDPGALPGLDVGSVGGDCDFCGAGLDRAAFWVDGV